MTVEIRVYCSPELKQAAGDMADKLSIPLSELVARKLAEGIGRPDLSSIPRKPQGRPRNKLAVVS